MQGRVTDYWHKFGCNSANKFLQSWFPFGAIDITERWIKYSASATRQSKLSLQIHVNIAICHSLSTLHNFVNRSLEPKLIKWSFLSVLARVVCPFVCTYVHAKYSTVEWKWRWISSFSIYSDEDENSSSVYEKYLYKFFRFWTRRSCYILTLFKDTTTAKNVEHLNFSNQSYGSCTCRVKWRFLEWKLSRGSEG